MNVEKILRRYISSRKPILEEEFNELNDDLKKSYIDARSISIKKGSYPESFEIPFLSEEVILKMIKHYTINVDNLLKILKLWKMFN